MRSALSNNTIYREKQAEITHLNWQKGIYNFIVKRSSRKCIRSGCINTFIVPPSDTQKFCSHRCFYEARRKRPREALFCKTCSKSIVQRNAFKFCSLRCQAHYKRTEYLQKWKSGFVNGTVGINTITLSKYVRSYLLAKYGEKCSLCNWDKKHPITKVVPLEVDHIDGDPTNNKEENLRIVCPNCHSLTPSFRNLNKGKGRGWRLEYLRTH